MKGTSAQRGYIMIVTLIVVSLAIALVTFLVNRGMVYAPFMQTFTDRCRAQELAMSGVNMAMSQLAYADVVSTKGKGEEKEAHADEEKEPGKDGKKEGHKGNEHEKKMLMTLLPLLGRWQTFALNGTKDGIDATIKICVMSEDGKINLNELYDFQGHTFDNKDVKIFLEGFCGKIGTGSSGEEAFKGLEAFLKGRDDEIRDVTELVTVKAFDHFKNMLFYSPDEAQQVTGKDKKKNLYLTDIFTVWSHKRTIDPWLLSHSVCALLGLERPAQGLDDQAKQLIKNFKSSYGWPADWNTQFAKMYKKNFNGLPKKSEVILNPTFGPETFSVLSYATVGQSTHRIFAIVERDMAERKNGAPARMSIKKIYWI